MVSHLIRLRYRLTWNGLRRSVGATIGAIFSVLGYLYLIVLAYLLAIVVALAPVEELSYANRGGVLVLAAAVVLVIWIVGPIVSSASNPFTNAKNFLPFAIPNKQFVAGVVLGGVVAPTGIGTFVLLFTGAVLWGWRPAAILAGVIAAVLGTLLCVTAMQVFVGLMTNVISKRAVRDALQLIVLVPLMLGGFVLFGAIETIQQFVDILPTVATWVAFTPGGFLALPWFVAQGQWGLAGLHLVVMVVYLAALVRAYGTVINRTTRTAGTAGEQQREQAGLGLIGRAKTPRQAIWARALLYWLKDPRYSASLVIVGIFILFGVLETTVLDIDFLSSFVKILPALIAYLLAFSISADLSYDSTGFSLHITSGVRGLDDRVGRVLALLTWALPLVVVVTILMTIGTGVPHQLAAWLGLSIGVLLVGTGLSAVLSARYIYPVPPPGTSLMASPEGGLGRTMLVQTVGMTAQIALSTPVIVLAIIAILTDSQFWGIATLLVGVLYGLGILWAGVRLGAKWYERSLPETYQSIVKVTALY